MNESDNIHTVPMDEEPNMNGYAEISDELRLASFDGDAMRLAEAMKYAELEGMGLTEEDMVFRFVRWRKNQ